jgi:hypothetical protein
MFVIVLNSDEVLPPHLVLQKLELQPTLQESTVHYQSHHNQRNILTEPISHIDWGGVQGQVYKVNFVELLMSILGLVLDY